MPTKKTLAFQTWESGQGLVEYFLILAIVAAVIACVLFYAAPAAWRWITGTGQQPTSSPALNDEAQIEKIAETGSVAEVVDTETTSTDNCNNSSPTEIQTQRIRKVEHLVILQGQAGVEIGDVDIAKFPWLKFAKIKLEGQYGIQDKQVEERSYTVKFTTGAKTSAAHTIKWKYTWRTGEVRVKLSDGAIQNYTYKVRTTLEPETTSVEKPCPLNLTSTPTSTLTVTPTVTPKITSTVTPTITPTRR